MFTGIVTETGTVLEIDQNGDMRVKIGAKRSARHLEVGGSVACDGVCLTAISIDETDSSWFGVNISEETLSRTAISSWYVGRRVNLERSLRIGDELGGHIVSGHVDGVAETIGLSKIGDSLKVSVAAPPDLAHFIAPKGSIALNGVSLTVNEVSGSEFFVNIIPHTREITSFDSIEVGDALNLEIDTIARYVDRILHLST